MPENQSLLDIIKGDYEMSSASSSVGNLIGSRLKKTRWLGETSFDRLQQYVQKSIAIALFLLIWELAPRLGFINRDFLPPFSEILVQGYDFAITGKLLPHVLISLSRALGGFALGVITAVPLGILLGWHSTVERYLNPLLQLLRQFNSISLLPVFILFFGVGYFTKVVIIYWVVVWPILLSTVSGVKYVDPILVKYGKSLSLTDWQIFTRIVAPSAIPSIIAGMRLAATYSFLVLVASEQVGASSGLGYLVENAQYLMGIHMLYVAVLMLVALGFAANQSLVLLERRLTRWKSDQPTYSN
ncbi:ABC transporter permease [Methylocystis parvus]|uniref:ABC transporter permease n=1 Tax=Methylocystis parvus TaxID=134 RepID=A0A6B8M581_9HYPH|nr:ABC transporter permease [Methylocystis parvus]QGM97568.1 ABC transporter permease [Methylocystis parvus]WBJ98501.1 ABC transporter permease [Methylocystis parvus OBBP]